MIIEDCWFCGGEADTSVDDDGYVFIGCKDANCPNNIFNSDNAFDNEFDAIVWWNDEARKVYEQCPKMVVQTNEDWFCGLSTEEKADALTHKIMDIICWNNDPKPSEVYITIKNWLKREHE